MKTTQHIHIQVETTDQFTVRFTQRLGYPVVTIESGVQISFPDMDTLVRFRDEIHNALKSEYTQSV